MNIIPGVGYGEETASRDSVVRAFRRSNHTYDALHYLLLFPSRDDVWQQNIPHQNGKRNVTTMGYYSYRLMVRSSQSPLHLSGIPFHQVRCRYVGRDSTAATELHHSQTNEDPS
ncbi:hypothetical protein LOD99_13343 [Oopsacas minuta]|uniref:Uncharacterized protein n=1 Tax=Oopsacas minuta TaxID=111878 RepID=A0AAV7KKH3_9METZ|nr:hypothetical protein LOD99_13343 [Oopsacas minuta]